MALRTPDLAKLVRAALREDIGPGDATTNALVPAAAQGRASIVAKQDGVIAGLPLAALAFRLTDRRTRFRALVRDGAQVPAGTAIARITGSLRGLLTAERTALNFLQRLSGIATLTRFFVTFGRPYGVTILDTRKTTPGLRAIEKYAVRMGKGKNHRFGLFDMVLIKDNHIAAVGSIRKAVAAARKKHPKLQLEVECQSMRQVREAVAAKPDIIMLDNLPTATMRTAIRLIRKHRTIRIELSGGVSARTIKALAALRPDVISVGALTHSAPALDLSLDIEPA